MLGNSGFRVTSVPLELSEQLHALIRNSEVAVLSANVGHALQLEAHEQLNSKLSAFLERLS